jgi:hypothetical protein
MARPNADVGHEPLWGRDLSLLTGLLPKSVKLACLFDHPHSQEISL